MTRPTRSSQRIYRPYGRSGAYARALAQSRRSRAVAFAVMCAVAGVGGFVMAPIAIVHQDAARAFFSGVLLLLCLATGIAAHRGFRAASAADIGAHAEEVMAGIVDAAAARCGGVALHDVRGIAGNIDHMVRTPTVLLVIETKAYRVARADDPRLHAAVHYVRRQVAGLRQTPPPAVVQAVVALPLCRTGSEFVLDGVTVLCGDHAAMIGGLVRLARGNVG